MRLPFPIRQTARLWALRAHVGQRPPDFVVGSPDAPYLQRWYVVRNGQRWRSLSPSERAAHQIQHNPRDEACATYGNIFVHRFLRSDDDRALHDHPWLWRTLILDGEYVEHIPRDARDPAGPTVAVRRRAGDSSGWRYGHEPHRVELIANRPVLTLFQTGTKYREWGFWCGFGWRHWRDFTSSTNSGEVGRGCGD